LFALVVLKRFNIDHFLFSTNIGCIDARGVIGQWWSRFLLKWFKKKEKKKKMNDTRTMVRDR
jgi:hypothetical protein